MVAIFRFLVLVGEEKKVKSFWSLWYTVVSTRGTLRLKSIHYRTLLSHLRRSDWRVCPKLTCKQRNVGIALCGRFHELEFHYKIIKERKGIRDL